MKLYFDTCCLQRFLDDKSQLRIALESEAVLGLLEMCETEKALLVSSDVLILENQRNPEEKRKVFVTAILEKAADFVAMSDAIGTRAKTSNSNDSKPLMRFTLPVPKMAR